MDSKILALLFEGGGPTTGQITYNISVTVQEQGLNGTLRMGLGEGL